MSDNTQKEIINIGINGGSIEHRVILSLLLEDFLEFTGFEAEIKLDTDLSDDQFNEIVSDFPTKITELVDTSKIIVHEIV